MIVAGLGVGLLPMDEPTLPGVRLLPMTGAEVRLRCYAVTRCGRAGLAAAGPGAGTAVAWR
jgi:hypothetical protein